jgi:hypothetical protein
MADILEQDDEDKAFDAAFQSETSATEVTKGKDKEAEKPGAKIPEPEPKAKKEAPKDAANPPEDGKSEAELTAPEYVQISKEDWEATKASAVKTEAQLAKAFGTMGQMQQVINALKDATAKGEAVELTDDVVAEIKADYPDLAAPLLKALQKALNGQRGTGKADDKKGQDAAKDKISDSAELIDQALAKREIEALEEDFPHWRDIVGATAKGVQPDPENPYRKWLSTQSPEYQKKVNETNSSAVVRKSIEKFQTDTAAPAPKPAPAQTPPKKPPPPDTSRQDRIKGAIQPRGDGGSPARQTEEDPFEEGFRTGRD